MRRGAWMLASLLVFAIHNIAIAQDEASVAQEKLGERLFNRSCVLCHKNPQVTSGQYAPLLSKDTLGGKAEAIAAVIRDGSPHMPGFKFLFTPTQIDAVAAYVETLPPAAAASPGRKGSSPGEPD